MGGNPENTLAAIAAAVMQAELAYEFLRHGWPARRREGPRRVFGGGAG